jgi:alkylhydroperoxidase family enzyme
MTGSVELRRELCMSDHARELKTKGRSPSILACEVDSTIM